MASLFPSELDSFSNPTSTTSLADASLGHASQHAKINDAIEAIEATIGISGSTVNTSLEYRLSQIEAVAGLVVVKKTADEWTAQNPNLLTNQLGLETDTLHFKFGTGSAWTAIGYANITAADLGNSLGDYIPVEWRGNPSGVASLNSNGFIPDSEIPSTITRDTELSSHTNATTSVHGISDTSELATKTYADTAAANAAAAIVDSAPSTLNTLNELAAAINDDASYAATITTALGLKQDIVSGVSDTEIGYLDGVTEHIQVQFSGKANNLISYVTESGSSRTVGSSDLYKIIECTSSSATTITIPSDPSDTSFPIGSTIEVRQIGTGRITFTATSPATLVSTDSYVKTRTQYSSAILEKRASNAWILTGDIDA